MLVTTSVQPAAQGPLLPNPHVVAQGKAQSYGLEPSVPYVVPHWGGARDDDVWGNNGWERGDAAIVMAGEGVMPGIVPPPPPLPSAQSDEAAVAEQSERRALHQLIEALRQELLDAKVCWGKGIIFANALYDSANTRYSHVHAPAHSLVPSSIPLPTNSCTGQTRCIPD